MKTKALIRKSQQLKNNRSALPFSAIKSVLVLWDATQARAEIEEIKTFGHELRSSGKEVVFLTFHPIKKFGPEIQPNDMYRLCCRGDFNFFAAPKSPELKKLLETPFDLLINGCLTENEFIKTISVYSKSKFRVGPFLENDDTNFYELLIKPNGADPCENYLIEIGRSLKKIQ